MRNVESLLPEAVRLRELLNTASRATQITELDETVVRLWKEEIKSLLETADRMGTELTEDRPQGEICAACMLGLAKKDLQCFASAINAFLKVGRDGTIVPSARTKARLWEEADRLQWKLNFIVTVAGMC